MALRTIVFLTLLSVPLSLRPAAAADDLPGGAGLARNCLICHAKDYHDVSPVPRLTGLDAAGIVEALREYRTGRRPATIMDRIASGYSDAEIDRLAAYLAGLHWGEQ